MMTQRFNTITALRLQDCSINGYGIILIAEMLTNTGCLRDLNLDMNPNSQENYHLLCTPAANLSHLSLKLCAISDIGLQKISNELRFQEPPNTPKLISLNLANNRITDVGANYIAVMLRSNRSLQSLVLSGNRIHDDGASLIIQELKMVTLTHTEVVDLRRWKYAEIILQMEMDENEEIDGTEKDESSKKTIKTRRKQNVGRQTKKLPQTKEDQNPQKSAKQKEMIFENEKYHPFLTESSPINKSIVASGNLHLQHLNLNFNHLTNQTLKTLICCLQYQIYMLREDRTKGLLNILIEGYGVHKNSECWKKFVELLRIRLTENQPVSNDFQDFVPEESKLLRENIQILN